MFTRYLIALSVLTLSGCTLSDMITTPDKSDTGMTTDTGTLYTGSLDPAPPLTEDISGSGGVYYAIFQGLETRIIPVKHGTGETTKISFTNSVAKSMHVVVTFPATSTGGNLRLSQIVMPDGNMDGPFGTDSTIALAQLGGYELIFHENMMSGDPWSGNAIVTITLMGK